MTYTDLIDEIAASAGDTSGSYRAQVRRWLNLARSRIADSANWRSAFRPTATFTASAGSSTGVFTISGYEAISGDWLYDETNDSVITYESFAELNAIDPSKSVTGPADFWADAGEDGSGNKQILLYPIPDANATIRFAGTVTLTDIGDAKEGQSVDTYFGIISQWSACFLAGMRYYQAQDNGEQLAEVSLYNKRFDEEINRRKKNNTIAPNAALSVNVIRTTVPRLIGRLDPAHYSNRE